MAQLNRLFEVAAPAEEILALDAGQLDLARHRTRLVAGRDPGDALWWHPGTSERLGWLLAGRAAGPVFLTHRRAPAGAPVADTCPFTGRARMSYRRAAEVFTGATRPLGPAGRGWALHQLRLRLPVPAAADRPAAALLAAGGSAHRWLSQPGGGGAAAGGSSRASTAAR